MGNKSELAARRFRTLERHSTDHANDGSEDRDRLLSIARPVPYHARIGTVKLLLSTLTQVTQDEGHFTGVSRSRGRVSRDCETGLNRTVDTPHPENLKDCPASAA